MFAHHVIEDISREITALKGKAELGVLATACNYTIQSIKKAQHFHLGDQHALLVDGPGKSMIKNKAELFMESPIYTKMPYKICTFSSTNKFDEPGGGQDNGFEKVVSTKRFSVVEQLDDETLFITLVSWSDKYSLWAVQVVSYLIRVGNSITNEWLTERKVRYAERARVHGNIHPVPLVRGITHDYIDEDTGDLSSIAIALKLLNCKNITTETHIPDRALNKARQKRGKQELLTYKTLKLLLPGNKEKHRLENTPTGEHNRIHFCRGHFKEYTADAPLFGRITGLWWWQPHVRGQNKDGIVMKDYEVKHERT